MSWVAMHNHLSIGDRMVNGISTSTQCVLCLFTMETRDHIFFNCAFLAQTWENLSRRILKGRHTTDIILLYILSYFL